jgi:NAD+ synthase (glutamine-hydrolysing)
MRRIKAATAVLNQTPLDWKGNRANISAALKQARDTQVSLICLPELCITGYGCEDAFQAPGVQSTALDILFDLLPETKGLVACFGLPILFRNAIYNVAALVADSELIGFAAKQNLAGDGLHYEPRWFKAWPEEISSTITVRGSYYPIGDLLFDIGGVRIGFEICEDAWVAHRPGASLARRGADVILNPSASHFAFGKNRIRERFVIEGSRAFSASYLYANLLGNEAGRSIYDGDAMIASAGRVLARGQRFSFETCQLTTAVIDVALTRMKQSRITSYDPDFSATEDVFWEHSHFAWPECEDFSEPNDTRDAWENSPHIKEEEFTRAMALGLHDYCRKSHSSGFVVSLSGGADSAACAILVDLMRHFSGNKKSTKDLLTCAYQSTRNSGVVTLTAAREVAEAIGATFLEFDVDSIVRDYRSIVEAGIGRELIWETDDITLQNIQARVRAPSVWMLANINNALLLSTSNRSEAAVGYATMDGDTCGGLSPIAGIDKAFLRQWLRWMEKEGPHGAAPIPALSYINDQQPTAELRPKEDKQTDEGDLMPYDLLDAIERAAIRDKKMPVEVFHIMHNKFAQYDRDQMKLWVDRFYRLWSRNQWKRERYAPSFHLDDENLDPKTWCRFPILSGGFQQELAELAAL